jgi:hypothetical protein
VAPAHEQADACQTGVGFVADGGEFAAERRASFARAATLSSPKASARSS